MQVDLTAAAKFYGLQTVPPIVADKTISASSVAAYDLRDGMIHVSPQLMQSDLTDTYDEDRFAAAGAPRLDNENAHKFVIAHELWHAHQEQQYGMARLHEQRGQQMQREREVYVDAAMAEMSGRDVTDQANARLDEIHDGDPMELDADRHAATAYQLIKFS